MAVAVAAAGTTAVTTPGKRRRALKNELDALKSSALAELEGAATAGFATTTTAAFAMARGGAGTADASTAATGLTVADVMARPAVQAAAQLCYPTLGEAAVAAKATAVVLNFFKNPHDSRVLLGASSGGSGAETFQFHLGGRDATPDINARTVVRVSVQPTSNSVAASLSSVLVTWASAVELAELWIAAGFDLRRPTGTLMSLTSLRSAVHAALRGNNNGSTTAFGLAWQVEHEDVEAGWAAGDQEVVRSATEALALLGERQAGLRPPPPVASAPQISPPRRYLL
jgi:hypothetical protein